MRDLDFMVIGAQKCATSWLYYCLDEHPALQLPKRKDEADYFAGARFDSQGGERWFDALYADKPGARLRGSVSVDYAHDLEALRRAIARFPHVRLVFCLRDPLVRTASAHAFLVRRSLLPESSLDQSVARAIIACREGRSDGVAELITRSLYGRSLTLLAELGVLDNTLVVSYDAIQDRPLETIRQVYAFLGVEPIRPVNLNERPKWNANLAWLTRLERLLPASRLMAKLMDHANRLLARTAVARSYPQYSPELKAEFTALIREDAQRAAQIMQGLPAAQRIGGGELLTCWGLASASGGSA